MTKLNLDALGQDIRRVVSKEDPYLAADLLGLIERVRELETDNDRFYEKVNGERTGNTIFDLLRKVETELTYWRSGQVHKNNVWMHSRIEKLERVRRVAEQHNMAIPAVLARLESNGYSGIAESLRQWRADLALAIADL